MCLKSLLNLFFPKLCVGCGVPLFAHEYLLCDYCRFNLPYTNYHLMPENPIEQMFWGKIRIFKATSFIFYTKDSSAQSIIHNLKYHSRPEVGTFMGRLAGNALADFYADVDLIVPVPLHPKKLKKRGYNQSEMIARGLSEIIGKPLALDALFKNKITKTQTKKNKEERFLNVRGSFSVKNAEMLENKHILLVDDVLTTGATLEACASALIDSHAKISVFTLGLASS